MRIYNYILTYIIFFITIFSLQLYLFAHEHSQLNIVLIAYVFILFNQCNIMLLIVLASMLDALLYITTNVTGLSLLWLSSSSWISLHIKDDMYNKIFIPCIFIITYSIFTQIIITYYIPEAQTLSQILFNAIKASAQNCLGLLFIWKISKKSFQN